MSGPATRRRRRSGLRAMGAVGAGAAASIALVAARPALAPWVGLCDGLAVGVVLGATGLVRSYDESWDEFWETTALAYSLGVLSLFVFWWRGESPSAFFWVEMAAGAMSYLMLIWVPPITWLGADLMLLVGTFTGWLASGLFRSDGTP
ncbi:MAG: hypothetical protein IT208_19795 [Chthonomonadales bacterium]|nr:hypothetical protein [Chthonomonadales bacterium]